MSTGGFKAGFLQIGPAGYGFTITATAQGQTSTRIDSIPGNRCRGAYGQLPVRRRKVRQNASGTLTLIRSETSDYIKISDEQYAIGAKQRP
jgi:hypothetical protein